MYSKLIYLNTIQEPDLTSLMILELELVQSILKNLFAMEKRLVCSIVPMNQPLIVTIPMMWECTVVRLNFPCYCCSLCVFINFHPAYRIGSLSTDWIWKHVLSRGPRLSGSV